MLHVYTECHKPSDLLVLLDICITQHCFCPVVLVTTCRLHVTVTCAQITQSGNLCLDAVCDVCQVRWAAPVLSRPSDNAPYFTKLGPGRTLERKPFWGASILVSVAWAGQVSFIMAPLSCLLLVGTPLHRVAYTSAGLTQQLYLDV